MSAVPVLVPPEFKRLLKKETKLLHSLFKVRTNRHTRTAGQTAKRIRVKIINGASEEQVNFLIQLVHFICQWAPPANARAT